MIELVVFIMRVHRRGLIVSELSKKLRSPEDSLPETGKSSSPAVMLVTLLLLISALSLTGFMMLHYARDRQPPAEWAPSESADETITLKDRANALLREFKKPPQTNAYESKADKDGGIGGLFTKRKSEVRWPRLKLTGLGTSVGSGEAFAIINGGPYTPGELIDGKVVLIEVRAHDVVVEYQGETKNLTIDLPEY